MLSRLVLSLLVTLWVLVGAAAGPAVASVGPSTAPAPNDGSAVVQLGDEQLFSLEVARGKRTASARARAATRALEDALRENQLRVTTTWSNDVAVIRVGDRVVVELSEADREASSHAALRPYADEIAARIRAALKKEMTRRSVAEQVLGVSSIGFLGLLAWVAMGLAGRVARRAERRIEENLAAIRGVRIQEVELIPAAAVREGLRLLVFGALWVVRIGLVYSWTLLALSLFGPTREYASRATGYLFAPALELFGRLASRVPILLALFFALAVVLLVVRFVTLYCGAVERGEIKNRWLRPETAGTSGTLIAIAICLTSLLFVTPLLAGTADGVLTRIGLLGVGVIALGAVPALGSCLLGIRIVYGHAWSLGDVIEYGGQRGRVVRMDLFDATLKHEDGALVRVPHLMSLWHPTRIYPRSRRPSSSSQPSPPA